jgi:hypothetical protein
MKSMLRTVAFRCARIAGGIRLVVPLVGAIFLLAPAALHAQASPYMTQTYIDTMVQRAFYTFNEAISLTAGQDDRLMEAITEAKRVCRRLRTQAKGDPNEKYVNWKVSELENHIILEERDLVLKKMRRGAAGKNVIITKFNAELAKDRPDFSALEKLYTEMSGLDAAKAAELEHSIRQRSHNLSRALAYTMEKAVINGDIDAMRTDLAYASANDRYLSLALDKYRQLEQKLQARESLERLNVELDARMAEARGLVDDHRFGEAWEAIRDLQGRIARARTGMEPRHAYRYDVAIGDLAERISAKEDSLVRVNLRILRDRGTDPAIDFLENVLRTSGISLLKTAKVDSAIVAVAGPRRSVHDEAIERELGELTRQTALTDLTLENARQIAARRAKERADSLRATAEAEARRLAELNRRKLEREAKLEAKRRKKREKARERITKIYAYLERDRVRRAKRRFERKRDFLEEYLSPVVFAMLEATIDQEYTALKTGVRPADAIPDGVPIQLVIDEPDVERTAVSSPPAATAPRPHRPPPAARPARSAAPQEEQMSNRDRAQTYVVKLYELLERNKVAEAYEKFQTIREPLAEHIDPEAFNFLRTSILQAYEYSRSETGAH